MEERQLTGHPIYVPADQTARVVALRTIQASLEHVWGIGNLRVDVARRMNNDGTVAVTVTAEGDDPIEELVNPGPSISGTAWISAEASSDLTAEWWRSVWYAFPDQEHTKATTGNADAGSTPFEFFQRYGRDLYGESAGSDEGDGL